MKTGVDLFSRQANKQGIISSNISERQQKIRIKIVINIIYFVLNIMLFH